MAEEAQRKYLMQQKYSSKLVFRQVIGTVVIGFLMLIVGCSLNSGPKNVVALPGEHQKATLPDGSVVDLNADTQLDYKELEDGTRVVHLEGEAFFEVKEGPTFLVESTNGKVEVSGTNFNVYARNDGFEVVCHKGKAKVTSGEDETILIADRAFVKRGKVRAQILTYALSPKPDWTNGISLLKNAPLHRYFDEIGRQYNVKIDFNENKERLYSGRFLHKDLDKALEQVCKAMELDYEIHGEGKFVTISVLLDENVSSEETN